ncbi:MAG: hypothetical protein ABEJ74_04465 [Haloferacaceae archaeon]
MDSENTNDSAFAQALGDLKRRGSNLLVVGTPAAEAHHDACDRFLGDERPERRRLLVLTDGTHDHARHHEGTETRVITRSASTRSAAAAQPAAPGADAGASRDLAGADLGTLSLAIAEDLADLEAEGEASAVRLCFDSLTPILEEYDSGAVLRFLHAVTNRVRGSSAMAHYHLPLERDSDAVRDVEESFDAVVQLRRAGGATEQRWHILQPDLDSGWLPL